MFNELTGFISFFYTCVFTVIKMPWLAFLIIFFILVTYPSSTVAKFILAHLIKILIFILLYTILFILSILFPTASRAAVKENDWIILSYLHNILKSSLNLTS